MAQVRSEERSNDASSGDDGGLPPGFEDLLEFAPVWAAAAGQERWENRFSQPMPEIERFYLRLLDRAPDIFDHVDQYPLDNLPPATLRLYRLLLSLAHAATSIEVLGQSLPEGAPVNHGVKLTQGPLPVA